MCKIIKFFFILFLFFPMYVFGATGLFWYEAEPVQYYAYISNEKGATAMCYDIYNDFLCGEVNVPYLNKIDVSDEVFIDGKLYVEFSYNNKLYYLDINDIDVANGNNETFQYRPTNTILTYKDIYLFEGPSYAYNKISKIPAGTKLEFNYANTLWAYTEYEGKKGWVNFYSYPTSTLPDEHSGCLENVNLEYHLYNDLKLSSSPFSNDEIVGVIHIIV